MDKENDQNMKDTQQKAFDFAADYSKQLITLSTAVITFMVTFLGDVFSNDSDTQKVLLVLAWLFFILSIGFGIWRLMALTGNLDPIQPNSGTKDPTPTITSLNVRIPAILQILLFLAAIILTGIFGCNRIYSNINSQSEKKEKNAPAVIILRETISGKDTVKTKDTFYLDRKSVV